MSALNKPQKVTVQLYTDHVRFSDEDWQQETGEELHIIAKQMMEGGPIHSSIKDGVRGVIGEVIIDYPDDENPQGIMGKPHKAKLELCFDNSAFDTDWKSGLAETLTHLASTIKATDAIPEGIRDLNGNSIGNVTITP